jgi:transcriptional regulator GlxA family with amidase domain
MSSRLSIIRNWPEQAQSSGYCVKTMAGQRRVSIRQLERFFCKEFKQRPHEWMRGLRLGRAVELLRDGSSVKETAEKLGYCGTAHLSNNFKKNFGISPTHYARHNFSFQLR